LVDSGGVAFSEETVIVLINKLVREEADPNNLCIHSYIYVSKGKKYASTWGVRHVVFIREFDCSEG